VGVRYKHMRNLQQVSRRQGMEIPKIEKKRSSPVRKGDEQPRIEKGVIDQPGMK